jgi:Uma2 family endonuclease
LNVSANPRSLLRMNGSTFAFLGNISFSIYMLHELAIQLTIRAGLTSNALLYPVSMILTVAAATGSYLWFERPFLRLKEHFAGSKPTFSCRTPYTNPALRRAALTGGAGEEKDRRHGACPFVCRRIICPMTDVLHQPATYEDLLKVPEHLVAEIVEGELFTSPRPASPHHRALMSLYRQLAQRFEDGDGGPGGWWIFVEAELHLGRDILVPDLAGWRKERLPEYPNVTYHELAPDWVCEFLSTSNARHDRFRKMPRYAAHKIPYAWIVDTVAKGVEIYERDGMAWKQVALHHGTAPIRAVPFDACEINLASLWID